jgi:hypothetical protein
VKRGPRCCFQRHGLLWLKRSLLPSMPFAKLPQFSVKTRALQQVGLQPSLLVFNCFQPLSRVLLNSSSSCATKPKTHCQQKSHSFRLLSTNTLMCIDPLQSSTLTLRINLYIARHEYSPLDSLNAKPSLHPHRHRSHTSSAPCFLLPLFSNELHTYRVIRYYEPYLTYNIASLTPVCWTVASMPRDHAGIYRGERSDND